MKGEDRALFSVEIDTFRYIAAYCILREQEKSKRDQGVIYIDFDALDNIDSSEYKEKLREKLYIKKRGTEQKGIGQDITIPHGILAKCDKEICRNNDVFAITNYRILEKICNNYKGNILDQSQMVEVL